MLWLYLWLPLATLALWALGGERFYEHMVVLEGYRSFLEHLRLYQSVIVTMAALYLGWALVNQIRFRGVERRRRPPAVRPEEMARFFGVDEAQALALRSAPRAVIHHGPGGAIERIELDGDGSRPPALPPPGSVHARAPERREERGRQGEKTPGRARVA